MSTEHKCVVFVYAFFLSMCGMYMITGNELELLIGSLPGIVLAFVFMARLVSDGIQLAMQLHHAGVLGLAFGVSDDPPEASDPPQFEQLQFDMPATQPNDQSQQRKR